MFIQISRFIYEKLTKNKILLLFNNNSYIGFKNEKNIINSAFCRNKFLF